MSLPWPKDFDPTPYDWEHEDVLDPDRDEDPPEDEPPEAA